MQINQRNVEIHILQAKDQGVKDNISLGKFMLTGIKNCLKKVNPRIESDLVK